MARLPGIRLNRVSLPGVQSPQTAVNEFVSQQAVARDVMAIGQQMGEVKARYDLTEATAGVAESLSEFEREYAAKQTYTAQEIRDLGLDHVIDVSDGSVDDRGVPVERNDIPAHDVYPLALQQASENAIRDYGEGIASEQVRREWLGKMREQHNEAVTRATVAAAQNAYKYEVSRGIQRIENARARENFGAAAAYVEALPIPEEQKEALRLENQQLQEANAITNVGASGDPVLMEETADALSADNYQGPFTDEVRHSYAADLRKKANAARAEEIAEEDRRIGAYVSDLELGAKLLTGSTTEAEIKDAHQKGWITSAKRTQLLEYVMKRDAERQERARTAEALRIASQTGTVLDPGNKRFSGAVNREWEDRIIAGEDPLAAGIQMMSQYRMMPAGVKGILRAANRADSGQLIQAAKLYNAGEAAAPHSMLDVSPETVGIVAAVAGNLRLGMSEPDAVASVQAWEAMSEAQQTAHKNYVKTNDDDNLQVLRDMIDDTKEYDVPWSFAEVEPTIAMATEFDMLTEKFLNIAGNMETAQQMAFDNIRQKWVLTNVNDEWQYIKYAPQVDGEVLRQDIETLYGPNTLIASDPATELQILNGEQPTYRLYKKQHDPDPLPAEGWQEEFQKQTGSDPAAINITTRKDADRYMQTLFSIGNYELPRYTYDSDAMMARETDKLLEEGRKERERRLEFIKEKEAMRGRISEAKTAREARLNEMARRRTERVESRRVRVNISDELPVPEEALRIQRGEVPTFNE